MTHWIDVSLILSLGWTLIHTLWQAILAALIIRLLWLVISRKRALWRYGLALTAMLSVLISAGFTFGYYLQIYQSTEVFEAIWLFPDSAVSGETVIGETISPPVFWEAYIGNLEGYFPYLVLIWFSGVLLMGLRMLGGCLHLHRLSRRGLVPLSAEWNERFTRLLKKMGLTRQVRWRHSRLITEPLTLRHFKPIILFPIGLVNQLTVEQVEVILLHELAHIRRRDYLVNWLQSMLELLFFYHPAVWWLSGEAREAREYCCDDLVLKKGGVQPILYAQTLTQLTALSLNYQASPSNRQEWIKMNFTMSIKGINSSFSQRIKRLFGHYEVRKDWRKPIISALLGIALLLFLNFAQQQAPTNEPDLPIQAQTTDLRQADYPEVQQIDLQNVDTSKQAPFIQVNDQELSFSKTSGTIKLISKSLSEKTRTQEPLTAIANSMTIKFSKGSPFLMVNNQVWKKPMKELETLDPQNIKILEYIDKKESRESLYGEAPGQNVLNIHTQISPLPQLKNNSVTQQTSDAQFQAKITKDNPAANPKPKPLIVINGEIKGKDTTIINQITPSSISHINVLKGPAAIEKYGSQGKDGVVEIFTKDADQQSLPIPSNGIREGLAKHALKKPLIIVNNEKWDRGLEALKKIPKKDIETIDILGPEAVSKIYQTEGYDGAIVLRLKTFSSAQKQKPKSQSEPKALFEKISPSIKIQSKIQPAEGEPLLVIDGQKRGRGSDKILGINPEDIETIEVLKGESAIGIYGEDGKDGVIIITTKAKAKAKKHPGESRKKKKSKAKPATKGESKTSLKSAPKTKASFQAEPNPILSLESQIKAGLKVFPNPFRNETRLLFDLPENLKTRISVYNTDGQLMKLLADDQLKAGRHEYIWNDASAPSGNYVVVIESGGVRITKSIQKQ